MSRTLTLELPDDVWAALNQAAQESHTNPADLAAVWLASRAAAPPSANGQQTTYQPLGLPKVRLKSEMTDAEKQAAHERFRRHAGIFDSGDPHFADNDRIDADLAREYADNHEPAA